mmetsp:Transcript_24760/g.80953  ORF Transcript_24760/g.80953 Transcript_24760/m.80953 type:complete len:272 (+) Transcript_24760:3042-3857(+)
MDEMVRFVRLVEIGAVALLAVAHHPPARDAEIGVAPQHVAQIAAARPGPLLEEPDRHRPRHGPLRKDDEHALRARVGIRARHGEHAQHLVRLEEHAPEVLGELSRVLVPRRGLRRVLHFGAQVPQALHLLALPPPHRHPRRVLNLLEQRSHPQVSLDLLREPQHGGVCQGNCETVVEGVAHEPVLPLKIEHGDAHGGGPHLLRARSALDATSQVPQPRRHVVQDPFRAKGERVFEKRALGLVREQCNCNAVRRQPRALRRLQVHQPPHPRA